ncbi:MAG: methyltransferase domain-containing protein [Elusimicrobia bacterium]|nr:methyltransferase domain-containing protein [Elusimicrobiota bacterium]
MKATRDDKDILDKLEEFFDEKIQPKVKEIEKVLKKEIELGKLKPENLIEYDADSPFSYITAFLGDKGVTSVAPSTKFLVDRTLKAMDLDEASDIVEFGPGEGVMTRRILHAMPEDGKLITIELNPHFARTVRRIRDPRLRVVQGDVQEVERHMERHGMAKADVVVSGVPFSFFDPPDRHRLVEKIKSCLKPGGRFVAYQVTTHLIPVLKRHFKHVDGKLELRNLPPHFVFRATD